MTMHELRRQVATTEELQMPSAGNLICVYQHGAFEIINAEHIATLRRNKIVSR